MGEGCGNGRGWGEVGRGGLFAKGDFGGIGDWGILVVEGGVREGLGGRVRAKDAKDAKVRKGEC